MGGVEGVRFVPLNLMGGGATPDMLTRLLLTGAVLRGRIAADGALLNLIVGGQKLQLPKGVALSPGTNVEARITHEGGTPHLRLQVLPQPTRPGPGLPAVSTQTQTHVAAEMLPASLASLVRPEEVAALLPKASSIIPNAIETLLKVFTSRSEFGATLAKLVPLLDAQVAEGRMPTAVAARFRAVIASMDAETPDEFRRAVELARETIGSRIPQDVNSAARRDQGPTAERLMEEILYSRERASMRPATADSREFVRVADSFLDRANTFNLQNIRAFDVPYQFFAIPFSPRTGIEHAQVHVLGRERGGSGGGAGREAYLVAIDLHLTNLGSMWITIQSSGSTCNCAIRTDNDVARGAIDAGAPMLEAGLRRAGFAAAQVRSEAWDGDRVNAAAVLFAQTASFEAEA